MNKSRFLKLFVPLAVVIVAGGALGFYFIKHSFQGELRSISSESELYSFYNRSSSASSRIPLWQRLITLPFSIILHNTIIEDYSSYGYDDIAINDIDDVAESTIERGTSDVDALSPSKSADSSGSDDFSTTNIQVENVDEADIIKTDGKYLYSLSGADVVITNVEDPTAPAITSRISAISDAAPVNLILADDVLAVISSATASNCSRRYYYSSYRSCEDTLVQVYDLSDRSAPSLKKSYRLFEPYYTSRRIDNQLYVISSGALRLDDSSKQTVSRAYEEDLVSKTYPLSSIQYLKDVDPSRLTLISVVDLANLGQDISISPFLLDVSNAYVSESAFYLLSSSYGSDAPSQPNWRSLFGVRGLIGFLADSFNYDYDDYGYKTSVYKFAISPASGTVSYVAKAQLSGETINQYSLDEQNGHLRLALKDSNESYIAILDERLQTLGVSGRVGKGEQMYASRFLGDRAYLVTYRNTDPLFVFDLSDEKNPRVLGELKIPGYSVYLHPYDETHLIGIGMNSEESVRRDVNGRVISTSATITGMKMALFDVSDVRSSKEISSVAIGDHRTTSAILTNPKALLFSKEKELLAIPVNNYPSDFSLSTVDGENLSSLISRYRNSQKGYTSEGYLVYNINLSSGITQKGSIVHEQSSLIRGAYIGDNLFTVSEQTLKVNQLDDLSLVSSLNLSKQ